MQPKQARDVSQKHHHQVLQRPHLSYRQAGLRHHQGPDPELLQGSFCFLSFSDWAERPTYLLRFVKKSKQKSFAGLFRRMLLLMMLMLMTGGGGGGGGGGRDVVGMAKLDFGF